MKTLLLIPILFVACLTCSCRTKLPTDPNTMKPSTRCLPENVNHHDSYHEVIGSK